MRVKDIVDENYQDYKLPSMFISAISCDWKCCKETRAECQNSALAKQPTIDIDDEKIYQRYISNPLTKAIVIGGLEPMLQFQEVYSLIKTFRDHKCYDDFVIYTGYDLKEIKDCEHDFYKLNNIIVKYGRYFPNQTSHYDNILGIKLASDNQYAKKYIQHKT